MMDRRNLLVAAGALGLSRVAWAQAARAVAPKVRPVVDVVKVMSFSCSFCLTAETQDRAIEAAAVATGGRLVRAPVPESPSDIGARERAYYAARDMDAGLADRVKAALYRGSQDAQVTLGTYAQVYYWLERDLPDDYAQLQALIKRAQEPAAAAALERAIRLTISSGAQQLPTYVLLADGALSTTLDRGSAGASSMVGLRDAVIARINSL